MKVLKDFEELSSNSQTKREVLLGTMPDPFEAQPMDPAVASPFVPFLRKYTSILVVDIHKAQALLSFLPLRTQCFSEKQ